MLILAKLIGLMVFLMGVVAFINPKMAKNMMAFFQKGNRIYIVGFMRILFGAILLLAAGQCKLIVVVYALGLLIGIAGCLIFIVKPEKIKAVLAAMSAKPDSFVRMATLVAVAIGALILYSV